MAVVVVAVALRLLLWLLLLLLLCDKGGGVQREVGVLQYSVKSVQRECGVQRESKKNRVKQGGGIQCEHDNKAAYSVTA